TGSTPAQIRHAYGVDQISFNGGAIPGDGSGMTIAIVDAFDDPNIANDLHQFDLQFGLPDPTLTKVNQTGGASPLPSPNGGWASEIALDVERSEEHTSELQSRGHLVCRLLLEKKNKIPTGKRRGNIRCV